MLFLLLNPLQVKHFSFILAFILVNSLAAQELILRKGMVVDSLPVNDSIAETYSLYLPTEFTKEREWPVVFVFDPEGRARTATQLFRQAAEEQGYIIAATNHIEKDSTLLGNVKAGTRLINGVLNYFPVDRDHIYMAGLAEGARVASVMPAIYKNIRGVLAVGDTWINTDFIDKGAKFSFVGMAGYKDYRQNLLEETANFLKKAGMPATTYKFEGDREWPDFNMISNALGTFTLQSMAAGQRPADLNMVESLYQTELETAEQLRGKMHFYKAYELLEKMEAKYGMYGKKDELQQRMKDIRRSKVYKDQRRQSNRAATSEAELRERYLYFFNEDVYASNFENLGWWSQQIKELEELQEGENQAEVEMAHRVQGLLQELAHNSFRDLSEANAAADPLVFTAILQTIFEKENPQGYLNIISISARDGDYYTALLYLEDLLKTGYDNLEALYNIPGTLDLKMSPEYNKIIQEYLGESKYYKL